MTENVGIWAYAVTRELPPARLAGVEGVGGQPVRTVASAGLAAVVSPVDLAEFGQEPLRRNLEDLAWLERVARAHHAVVDAVARRTPAVPVRLATVHLDDTRVGAMLARHRGSIAAALERVAGRLEWGVKAYAAAPATGADAGTADGAGEARTADGAGGTGTAGGGGRGAQYLRRRRAQLSAREETIQAALGSAATIHAELAGQAERAQRHAPQDPKLSGEPGPMVLNGAYLVDRDRADAFAEVVRTVAERYPAVRLQLTGPWPAYSFAAAELAEAEPATAGGGAP